jgi:transposase-like protein
MNKRRSFTPEFKAKVVLEVLSGAKSTAEACRQYDLQAQVLNRWKTEFVEQAHTIFEKGSEQSQDQARLAELERMVGRLTMELEVAKKVSSILNSPVGRNGR